MLEKTEGEIEKGQSRNTTNIGNGTKTSKIQQICIIETTVSSLPQLFSFTFYHFLVIEKASFSFHNRNMWSKTTPPPSQRVCRGQNRHQVSPPQMHQSSKRDQPRGNPGVQKWDRELLRLEGASVGCAGCINSQPTRPSDETQIKPRSRVERLPPFSHVK